MRTHKDTKELLTDKESELSLFLDETKKQRELLESEIMIIKSCLKIAADNESTQSINTTIKENPDKKRGRRLDVKWRDILIFISNHEKILLNDLKKYISKKDYSISDANLRTQIQTYLKKGWLERVSPSVYKITDVGKKKCGYYNDNSATLTFMREDIIIKTSQLV